MKKSFSVFCVTLFGLAAANSSCAPAATAQSPETAWANAHNPDGEERKLTASYLYWKIKAEDAKQATLGKISVEKRTAAQAAQKEAQEAGKLEGLIRNPATKLSWEAVENAVKTAPLLNNRNRNVYEKYYVVLWNSPGKTIKTPKTTVLPFGETLKSASVFKAGVGGAGSGIPFPVPEANGKIGTLYTYSK